MTPTNKFLFAVTVSLFGLMSAAWPQDDVFTVKIEPGDTLFGLVRIHYPDSPARWSLIENEIFLANPHGFSDDNKSLLRVGAVLNFPVYKSAGAEAAPVPEPEPEPPRFSLVAVGSALELSGEPRAIDVNRQQRTLTLGSSVYIGDIILTENGSATRLQMNDGAQIYVRADSHLIIEQYSFLENSPQSNRSSIRLLRGGFRTITGLIGRGNPAAVNFATPLATIGVRGTDFAVRICEDNECSLPDHGVFPAGDYASVIDGEITVSNGAGANPVAFGEVVRIASADEAPVAAMEAAGLILTTTELALLEEKNQEPMNFFEWLRSRFTSDDDD